MRSFNKNSFPRNLFWIVGVIGALVIVKSGFERVRSEQALQGFQQKARTFSSDGQRRNSTVRRTPEQKRVWRDQQRRFARAWVTRREKSSQKELLDYLDDSDGYFREKAVRALGRLELAEAESPLRALAAKTHDIKTAEEWESIKAVPLVPLNLAIARIQSKNLNGQKKLDALAQSVGIEWKDIVRLSQRFYTPIIPGREPPRPRPTKAERQLMLEVVDVLYTMKKKGEDISPWEKQLTLPPAYKVILESADLSPEKEVTFILDYFASLKVLKGDSDGLLSHLVGVKDAKKTIFSYLPMAELNPKIDPPTGYEMLFYAAASFGDQTAIPLIARFESSEDGYVSATAKEFGEALAKNEEVIPDLP